MKLRNKKTGEVITVPLLGGIEVWADDYPEPYTVGSYDTISELNAEWEDAPEEEPKEYWCIDWTGGVNHITVLDGVDKYKEDKKAIGNYFETKEEAEKAVEKLKAWKRLKDKGFKITLAQDGRYKYLSADWGILRGDFSDVELLFGGEA